MNMKMVYVCMALIGLMMHHPVTADAGTIQWLTYDEAQKQHQGQDRKYLLYFQTDRCGYCRKLEQETLADKDIAAYINNHYIPVRVNTDRTPQVAARHGIRGVPDLHFLSPQGENIANWPGFIDADRLLPLLQYVHTDSYLQMSYRDFLQQK